MKTTLSILVLSSLLALSCSKPAIQSSAAQSNAAAGNTNPVAKAELDQQKAVEVLKKKVSRPPKHPNDDWYEFGGLTGPFYEDNSGNTMEVRYKVIHRYPSYTTGGDGEEGGVAKFRRTQNGKWYLIWRDGDIEIK